MAALALASGAVGCQDTGDGGDSSRSKPPMPAASSKTPGSDPGKGGGKESAEPSADASRSPGGRGPARALTCDQLRNAELQNSSLRLPDAPEGTIALRDGRWEGDGVVIELQPQCGIGNMTGDAAADAVGAIKVTAGGTGRFYALITWRNDAGTPVPAAAASLGDRTPVVSVDVSPPARQATVVYLTRRDSDPAAVVTLRRTADYRVMEPAMVEVRHSDAPYTP
jgi:hypothetical protein